MLGFFKCLRRKYWLKNWRFCTKYLTAMYVMPKHWFSRKMKFFFPPKIRKKIVGKSDHNIDPRFWTSSIILRTSNRFK
jgi:hypothetical protein